MNRQNRDDVKIGASVKIVLKADQRSGKLTEGVVARLLTNSSFHPHGIKVMLEDGQVGRVQEVIVKQLKFFWDIARLVFLQILNRWRIIAL